MLQNTHFSVSIEACALQLIIGSHFSYGSVLQISELGLQTATGSMFDNNSLLMDIQKTCDLQWLIGPCFT